MTVTTDSRISNSTWALAGAVVLLAMCGASGRAQEEKYRERQVLDPEKDEWVDQAPPEPGTPQGDLDQARSLLAQARATKARTLLRQWVKKNPSDERYIEGVFLLGDAEFERGDFWAAYKRYNEVVQNAGGELLNRALRRQMDVARAFLAGRKRIIWGFLRLPAYDDGIQILDGVWQQVPGTRMGEDALRTKANYYFDRGDMDLAQDEYVTLAREFPAGRFTQQAMLRAAEAANATFAGIKFDAHPLLEAEERYRHVQSAYPQYSERESVPERLEGIRQKRADKELDIARWYARTKQPVAAQFYCRAVIKNYPDTLAASEARNELRRMGVETEEEGPQK